MGSLVDGGGAWWTGSLVDGAPPAGPKTDRAPRAVILLRFLLIYLFNTKSKLSPQHLVQININEACTIECHVRAYTPPVGSTHSELHVAVCV